MLTEETINTGIVRSNFNFLGLDREHNFYEWSLQDEDVTIMARGSFINAIVPWLTTWCVFLTFMRIDISLATYIQLI